MGDVMSSQHSVVTLPDENILDITNRTVKIEPEKIINDVKKREIPRFKYDPPAQSVATAVQQLLKYADQVERYLIDERLQLPANLPKYSR